MKDTVRVNSTNNRDVINPAKTDAHAAAHPIAVAYLLQASSFQSVYQSFELPVV